MCLSAYSIKKISAGAVRRVVRIFLVGGRGGMIKVLRETWTKFGVDMPKLGCWEKWIFFHISHLQFINNYVVIPKIN